jgi:DNA-binding NarL/FixJ family response regulator
MVGRGLLYVDSQLTATRRFERSARLDFCVTSCRTVSEATGAADALLEPPECAVVGYRLTDGDGIVVARELRKRFPRLPILVLAEPYVDDAAPLCNDVELIQRCQRPRLLRFLQQAPLSRLWAVPALSLAIDHIALDRGLRPREVRILAFLSSGSTRTTLSKDLAIKEDTLKSQLAGLFERVEAKCTTELVGRILQLATTPYSPARGEHAQPPSGQSITREGERGPQSTISLRLVDDHR